MTPRKSRAKAKPSTELEVAAAAAPVKVASQRVDGGPDNTPALRTAALSPRTSGSTHDIQTTMEPWKTITVDETEYGNLLAQGFVYSGSPVAPAADGYDLLFADKIASGTATPQALADAVSGNGPFAVAQRAAFVAPGGTQWPMRNLGVRARAIAAGTPSRVKWLTMFDSYAQKIAQQMAPYLFNAFGAVAGAYFSGVTDTRGITSASTGTITDNTADFAAWPSGLTSSFAAGATRTYGQGGGNFIGDTIRVFWINDGGGTFKIQVDGVVLSTPAVTSDGSLGIATITVTRGSHNVTIVGLTGTAKIVGVGYEDSTVSGMCFINVAAPGIAMNSPTAQAWANFGTFLAAVQPDVLTWETKEDSSWLAASLDTFLTTIQAHATACDVVLVQSPPQSSLDADNVAQNTIIRQKAAQYGVVTWDSYSIFRDYATLTTLHWEGDGTHVSTDADAYRGLLMFRDLGIFTIAAVQPLNTRASTVDATENIRLGTTLNPPVLELLADLSSDLDATAKIKRLWHLQDVDGNEFALFDARNGADAPSALPHYSQIGSGNAGLSGENTDILSVRRWGSGNLNGWGDLGVRSLITAVAPDVTGTGAITLDLSQGAVFQVWMTGNITGWSFANPSWGGQEIEVHFIQDATGGRTLAGADGSIHLAGGALTLSTGASKRDIVHLRQVGGSYYEVARTLGL